MTTSDAHATAAPPRFLGRAEVVELVDAALAADDRLVVVDVCGTGGVGKSALLDELARRRAETRGRCLRIGFADLAAGAAEGVVTDFRTILEGLAAQVEPTAAKAFRDRVRPIAANATGLAGIDVACDEMRDAFVDLLGPSQDPILVLGDDVSALGADAVRPRLAGLIVEASKVAPVVAVLTRTGAPGERTAYPGRIVRVELGALTRAEAAELLPDARWVDAVDEWCGFYPAAVALAVSIARTYPDRTELLVDPAVLVPSATQLLEELLASLGDDAGAVLEVAAVAGQFDVDLLRAVLAEQGATASVELGPWLRRLAFVEPLRDDRYALRPFLRVLLVDRLHTQPPRRADQVGSRLDELQVLVTEAYAQRSAEDVQERRYGAWLTLEDAAVQQRQLEFLRHALLTPALEDGWFSLVRAWFDSFWWWGAYVESDYCRRLLDEWERQARPVDRPLLEALRLFERSYPPESTGRPIEPEGVLTAVEAIAAAIGLRDSGLTKREQHVRAILDVCAGEAHRVRNLAAPAADDAFLRARQLFEGNAEDSWCVPWVLLYESLLALERRQFGQAETIAQTGLRRATDGIAAADRDYEVEAGLRRAIADSLWARGERWTAFRQLARASLAAYLFTSLPDPPDEYTRTYYRDVTGSVLDRIEELLPDRDAARRACHAFVAFWQPYWELTGGAPDLDSVDALLDRSPRDVAVCVFPPEPSDDDIDREGPYAATARRVRDALVPSVDEALEAFGGEGLATRLRGGLRRRREQTEVPALDLPAGPAEPDELFEPGQDPVWPDHWRTFPRAWRELAGDPARTEELRAVVRGAIDALPATWRTVLERRDVDGWTYQDVARRLGIPRSHQTLMLHHARARIRSEVADHLTRPAP